MIRVLRSGSCLLLVLAYLVRSCLLAATSRHNTGSHDRAATARTLGAAEPTARAALSPFGCSIRRRADTSDAGCFTSNRMVSLPRTTFGGGRPRLTGIWTRHCGLNWHRTLKFGWSMPAARPRWPQRSWCGISSLRGRHASWGCGIPVHRCPTAPSTLRSCEQVSPFQQSFPATWPPRQAASCAAWHRRA